MRVRARAHLQYLVRVQIEEVGCAVELAKAEDPGHDGHIRNGVHVPADPCLPWWALLHQVLVQYVQLSNQLLLYIGH